MLYSSYDLDLKISEFETLEFMNQSAFIIVETNDLYRLGLKCIIEEQIQLPTILTATTKLELSDELSIYNNATVIIDYDCLSINSIEELEIISSAYPLSNWLFVADLPDETFLIPLTSSFGRANFVLKTNSQEVIATAIFDTMSKKKYFCSEALQIIMDGFNRKSDNSHKNTKLTHTELELINLLAQGKSAKEIATQRCISHHTINTHRKNIFRKLGLNNVQELIKFALKNGLVDLTEYYI